MNKTLQLVLIILGFTIFGVVVYVVRSNLPKPPSWAEREAIVKKFEADLQQKANRIQGLQGNSRCGTDEQCRVVGLGSSVCKGYKDFLVYSVTDTNEQALLRAVKEFNEAAERVTDLILNVPSCGLAPAKIKCVRSHCMPEESNGSDNSKGQNQGSS